MKTCSMICTLVSVLLFLSCEKPSDESITTPQTGAISDKDGNTYKSVTIGTQEWLAENLKTTKYSDGSTVPLVTDPSVWLNTKAPAYCWLYNDIANKNKYGALYNWYAVNTGKLCPSGWHVPTEAEWTTLVTFLGGSSVAGGLLKEVGTAHWQTPSGATNSTFFYALPGGLHNNGGFDFDGVYGFWWMFDKPSYMFMTIKNNSITSMGDEKYKGFSVRCLKN